MDVLGQLFWASDPQTQGWIKLILAVGAIGLVFLYLPLYWRVRRASRLSRQLARASKHSDTSRVGAVEELVSKSFLAEHWTRFKSQWRDSKMEPSENRAPVRWRDIFDDHPLLGAGARRSMLAAIPGIFLALGILGTFVGLTLAIQGIDLSPSSPSTKDSTPATRAIAGLVEYMGLAFRTSLWGMVLSMFAALSIRWLEGRADWLEERLSDLGNL